MQEPIAEFDEGSELFDDAVQLCLPCFVGRELADKASTSAIREQRLRIYDATDGSLRSLSV